MRVLSRQLDLETPTGPMRPYLYEPQQSGRPGRNFPGLALYSEIFQQTAPITRLALQFASQGYIVMVPEVYHTDLPLGTVLGYDDAGKQRGNELKTATPLAVFDADARVVIQALQQHPHCDGRLGVCLGGHLCFRAALNPEILAAACFFATDLHTANLGEGEDDDSLRRCAEISGELLMIWGRQDPHIPFEGRQQIYQALHTADRCFTWHEFNCAHAFMRDEGERYDPQIAHVGLRLAFDLFKRNL